MRQAELNKLTTVGLLTGFDAPSLHTMTRTSRASSFGRAAVAGTSDGGEWFFACGREMPHLGFWPGDGTI